MSITSIQRPSARRAARPVRFGIVPGVSLALLMAAMVGLQAMDPVRVAAQEAAATTEAAPSEDDTFYGGEILQEIVIVTANRATVRQTPVAFTNVTGAEIRARYTTQDTPELLKSVPGVFSRTSGLGESALYVRGFDAEHVQVMINNVPVNDPESQVVYWSNWTGLSGNAADIQVQRGSGSSLYGSGSFGGSVNIETDNFTADQRIGFTGTFGQVGSGNNNYITALDYASGPLANGKLSLYLRYERKAGDSYIDQTFYDGHSYYFGLQTQLGTSHLLTFNYHGAPQEHNQAGNVQDPALLEKFGRQWNRWNHPYQQNYYYKPVAEIHHEWDISSRMNLDSTLFYTTGDGGGRYLRNDYVNPDTGKIEIIRSGTFSANRNYATGSIFGNSFRNDSQNLHKQFGFNTTLTTRVNDYFSLYFGGELRDWKAQHYADAELFEFGDEGPGKPAQVVPFVEKRYDYDGNVLSRSVFLRTAINPVPGKLSVMLDAQYAMYDQEVVEKRIRQYDYFNRRWTNIWARQTLDIISNWNTDGSETTADVTANPNADPDDYDRQYKFFQPKFGINYNITDSWNTFLNYSIAKKEPKVGDWYNRSTPPLSDDDLQEESLTDLELGFGFRSKNHAVTVNLYHMEFEDKIESTRDSNGDRWTINAGNADHDGFEIAYRGRLTKTLSVVSSWAKSSNKWTGFPEGTSEIFGFKVENVKDKYVPGAPQLTIFNELAYDSDTFFGYVNHSYWDDYYVLYDNSAIQGLESDGTIGAFSELSLGVGYHFSLGGAGKMDLSLRAANVLGRKQYVDATYARDFGRGGGSFLGVTQSPEEQYFVSLRYTF